MRVHSKLPNVGTTIFTEINRIAQKHQAINLAQGFPGFAPDAELIQHLEDSIQMDRHQYAPMAGIFSLRESLCQKTENAYARSYHPETEITITAGATQAIFTAISAFVKKDDEVIVFKPAYDCYEPAIELQGAKSITIAMKAPDYKIDWEEVERKINSKTRMIIINTPHNPTGTILSKEDMQTLEKLVEGTDIIILSDEVYEHITFDGQTHQSAALFPKIAERAILIYSFGKTFHVTGWKLGYALAPEYLMKEFQKVHQFNVFCVNHFAQVAIQKHLQDEETYLGLSKFYQKKRDYFLKAIKGSKFEFIPSQGTYFQNLSYKNISDEKDTDFAIRLIKEKQLASIPVSVFQKDQKDEKMLRFCLAKDKKTLKKAAEILNSF